MCVCVCLLVVLMHARVWAGCLQVLAAALTRGQRRLHALSVLTDIRLWGWVWGLEATTHWTHTPPRRHRRVHTKRHNRIFHGISLGFTHAAVHPRSRSLLQFPPALFITSRPSSLPVPTYSSFHPSHYWLWWIDPGPLWPLTFLNLHISTHTFPVTPPGILMQMCVEHLQPFIIRQHFLFRLHLTLSSALPITDERVSFVMQLSGIENIFFSADSDWKEFISHTDVGIYCVWDACVLCSQRDDAWVSEDGHHVLYSSASKMQVNI